MVWKIKVRLGGSVLQTLEMMKGLGCPPRY